MTENKRKGPGRAARCTAAVLGVLLTLMLWLTGETMILGHVAFSGTVYNAVSRDGSVLQAQKEVIREKVELLASEKGFDTDNVMAAITDESLTELNRAAGEWIRSTLSSGRAGEVPAYPSEGIRQALEKDAEYIKTLSPLLKEKHLTTNTAAIRKIVEDKSMRMRTLLLKGAVKTAGKEISVRAVAMALGKLPLVTGLLSLLLAGLILLLTGRRPVMSLRWIGASLMAAAALLLLVLPLIPLLGLGDLLQSVSSMLAREASLMMLALCLESLLAALIMGAAGFLGMRKAAAAGTENG